MPDRYDILLANPSGVTVTPLAGDASGRRYARWQHPAYGSMIHMDARDDRKDGVADFIKIDEHLISLGLSAPVILARSPLELLLEDLGDDLFSRVIARDASVEKTLYLGATDLLIAAQEAPPPQDLPELDPATMVAAIAPAFDIYLKTTTDHDVLQVMQDASRILEAALQRTYPKSPRILLRDYHADNLLWLPKRDGVARVGVLDFQDAHLGHPAYDLASLLEDARRDVSEETREATIQHFLDKTNMESDEFHEGFCVQAAQRNLRILGVLANLSLNKGKRHYLAFLPRVWDHLQRDLAHPSLRELRQILNESLPAPTLPVLRRLEGPDA
ncbi:aminoglycoside phosphotransferase family protein [Falsihalocynthiibacter sp. SS001]|uniref:aminoglycoside phosphotransferase family protein n=1 Tax=Falsihalocynthiibacter sp. SS001 TaxID=3349698 RepID=UPI0036D26421